MKYALNGTLTPSWSWQSTGVSIPTGSWTHIAFVKDGTTVSVYLNGSATATWSGSTGVPATLLNTSYPLYVGVNGATCTVPLAVCDVAGAEFYNGLISEFRLWATARTGAQIAAAYDKRLASNLLTFPFDEPSGIVAYNSARTGGSALNGTYSGTASSAAIPTLSSPTTFSVNDTGTYSGMLPGYDASGDVTFAVGSQGVKGTVAITSATGAFTYTPTTVNTSGLDAFTYTVTRGSNTSAAQSIGASITDATAPTVTAFSSTTATGTYGAGSTINVTATTGEAVQSGGTITATLNTTPARTVTLTAASAGTTLTGTYTVQASDAASALTVASFTVGTAVDAAGNAIGSTTLPATNIATSKTLLVDALAPSMTITSSAPAILRGGTATITFTASEVTTDFAASDVSVNLGTLSAFTGSGTTYTATFTAPAVLDGTATISVAAASFTDPVGNGSTTASGTLDIAAPVVSGYTFDSLPATVTTAGSSGRPSLSGGELFLTAAGVGEWGVAHFPLQTTTAPLNWNVSFYHRQSGGTASGADGTVMWFAPTPVSYSSYQGANWTVGQAYEDSSPTTGLAIQFDKYESGRLKIVWNGTQIYSATGYGSAFTSGSNVSVSYDANGLDFSGFGVTLNDQALPGYATTVTSKDWQVSFGARTGGATDNEVIDNLSIRANGPGVTLTTDRSRSFNGTSDFIGLPDTSTVDDAVFTFEAWIKPDSVTGGRDILRKVDAFGLSINNGYLEYAFFNGSTWFTGSDTSTPVAVGVWTHVAFVKNGATLNIYRNGNPTATLTSTSTGTSIAANAYPYFLGKEGSGCSTTTYVCTGTNFRFYQGLMDNARLWDVARTGTQIAQTYATRLAADVYTMNFDEPAGTMVFNSSQAASTPDYGSAVGPTISTTVPSINGKLAVDGAATAAAYLPAYTTTGSLTFARSVQATGGAMTLSSSSTGAFSYAPNLTGNYSDSFAYTLTGSGFTTSNETVEASVTDTTAPTVSSFTSAQSSPTNASSITYTLTFSESVTGVAAADFSNAGTATGCSYDPGTDSGSTRTVTITGCGSGTIQPRFAVNGATDSASNTGPASASTSSTTLTYDVTAPTVSSFSSSTADGAYKAGATINITATTSEAIRSGNTLTVTLDTGATVLLTAASAGTSLTGTYTVGASQTSSDLTVSSFTIGTVADTVGNAMSSTTVPSGASNIAGAKAIVIDTTAPLSTATAPASSMSTSVSVGYTITAGTADVASVAAFYSTNSGLTSPTQCGTVTSTAASGTITCTLPSTSGTYYLFTKATDAAANVEGAPGSADATTVLDLFVGVPTDASRVFNGTRHAIGILDANALDLSTFTYEAWVKPTAAVPIAMLINKENSYELAIINGDLQYALAYVGGGWAFVSTGITIANGTWTHSAFVKSGVNVAVYVNGSATASHTNASQPATLNNTNQPLTIGARAVNCTTLIGVCGTANYSSFFPGSMSDVRLWSTARTGAQIAATYNRRLASDLLTWFLDEPSGTVAYNSAMVGGSALNGTYGGTTTSTDVPTMSAPTTFNVNDTATYSGYLPGYEPSGNVTFTVGTQGTKGTVAITSATGATALA